MKLPDPRSLRIPALLFVIFILAALCMRKGPDYSHYYDWAKVAATGDLQQIRSTQTSPAGVPHSQWPHGAGFIFAIPSIATGGLIPLGAAVRIAGAAAFLALWTSLFLIAKSLTKGDSQKALAACGAAFFCTHAGYYSLSLSSELFSLASLALLALFTYVPRQTGILKFAAGGAAAGILITTRPQLVLYGGVGVAILIYQLWTSPRMRRLEFIINAMALVVPVAAGAWQVAVTRAWMTGHAGLSPYLFGDELFKSVDFTNPQIAAVLVHPWHGLLLYHPYYLLGFAGLCFCIREERGVNRFALAMCAAALLAHLYHQASWYCWWLGTGTFGGRGMVVASVVLFPVLVKYYYEESHFALRALILACCAWSLLLFYQGDTNFYYYSELIRAMTRTAGNPALLASVLGAALLLLFYYIYKKSANKVQAGAIITIALGSGYSAHRLLGLFPNVRSAGSFAGFLVVLLGTLLLSTFSIWAIAAPVNSKRHGTAGLISRAAANDPPANDAAAWPDRTLRILGWATLFVLLGLLGGLGSGRAKRLPGAIGPAIAEAGVQPPAGSARTFDLEAVEQSAREYEAVPGFDRERQNLKDFIQRERARSK